MTQQQRLHYEQSDQNDIQQELKRLIAVSVYDKMRKMGSMVRFEEIEEYCN